MVFPIGLSCSHLGFQSSVIFQDNFEQGQLDSRQWKITRDGDFAKTIVEVYDPDPSEKAHYVLRLCANTIGTSDDTVKFYGVRSSQQIDFTKEKTISFDLDWNNQTNGSYLTAGIYLCPAATKVNPRKESDWLALQYVGVPPGKNARFQIMKKSGGSLHSLFTEGWPSQQRTGRKISLQHVELIINENSLKVIENGQELFAAENHGLNFTKGYLYLQMSSHSNYPSREIYFDNIVVQNTSMEVRSQESGAGIKTLILFGGFYSSLP